MSSELQNFQIDKVKTILGMQQGTMDIYDYRVLKLVNMVLSIARFHIWKIRCSVKYGDEQVSLQKSKNQLKYSLTSHFFF